MSLLKKAYAKGLTAEFKTSTGILYVESLQDVRLWKIIAKPQRIYIT